MHWECGFLTSGPPGKCLHWQFLFRRYLYLYLCLYRSTICIGFEVLINFYCKFNKIYNTYNKSVIHCCSVAKSYLALRDPLNCSMLDLPVPRHLLEFAQVHGHWIGDAIQPSHPLWPSSPSACSLSQHQGLFQWVSCLYQVAKVLKLQHQSFQWVFSVDFL